MPKTLDGAWAAVEGALPESWSFWEVKCYQPESGVEPVVYARVRLANTIDPQGRTPEAHATGSTPVAALQALTAKLRDVAR